jgi:hypothetical protein
VKLFWSADEENQYSTSHNLEKTKKYIFPININNQTLSNNNKFYDRTQTFFMVYFLLLELRCRIYTTFLWCIFIDQKFWINTTIIHSLFMPVNVNSRRTSLACFLLTVPRLLRRRHLRRCSYNLQRKKTKLYKLDVLF